MSSGLHHHELVCLLVGIGLIVSSLTLCSFCCIGLYSVCLSVLQCKYDFCWVCLEAWKKHSTATGGYFRCNRYEVVKKVEDSHDQMKTEVAVFCMLWLSCGVALNILFICPFAIALHGTDSKVVGICLSSLLWLQF